MTFARACFASSLLALAWASAPRAQTAPPDFVVEDAFPGSNFAFPCKVLFLPDGRALVVEIWGKVWMVDADGTPRNTPFLDLRSEVATWSDLGMLAAALDPDFATNRWVYFGYTVDPTNDDVEFNDDDRFVRVVRYQASLADSNVVDPSSRQVLIGATWSEGILTAHTSHTIGSMMFAPDKSLLVSCGEGAHHDVPADSGGLDPDAFLPGRTDPAQNIGAFRARSLNALGGKILRIDKETGLGLPSNPFWNGDPAALRSRVLHYGFRNPFRFCLRPGTGSTNPADGDPGVIYLGDVGMNFFEEFDVAAVPGANFGWPCYEGFDEQVDYQAVGSTFTGNTNVLCGAAANSENPVTTITPPKIWWHHFQGSQSSIPGWTGTAVVGGCFYTGTNYPPAYRDRYYLADWGGGWIRRIDVDANHEVTGWEDFITDASGPVDLVVHPLNGDFYYVSLFQQQVKRIRFTGPVGAPALPEPAPALHAAIAPNPFRGGTAIELTLPEAGEVSLEVYDVRGSLVRRLASAVRLPRGSNVLSWDGRDENGRRAARGTYFYRLTTEQGTLSGKLTSLE